MSKVKKDSTQQLEVDLSAKGGYVFDIQKRYVQFSRKEEKLLAQLKKILAPEVKGFVDNFYKHLLKFRETKEILNKPELIERLKKAQTEYYLSLLQGQYSKSYFEKRLKIGLIHEKIGLSPRWYLGAYSLYFQHFFDSIISAFKHNPGRIKKATVALSKLLLLDMQLVVEAYLGKAFEVIQSQNEQLAKLLSERTDQLRELEVGYSDLVENSPEMIFSLNEKRQFLSMNRTGLTKSGYTLDELKNKLFEDLMPNSYKARGIGHIQEVIESGIGELETVFIDKNGKELELEISSTALYNPSGEFLKARSFGRDVTERNKLEQQLLKWERLAAVGSMSAKVAHEIKNPLSSLFLNLELLEDEVNSFSNSDISEARQLLKSISSELERLIHLTEDYLQFARLPKPNLEPVGVKELLTRLVPLLGAELDRKGIHLQVEVPPNLPAIEADRNQLMQVFINLIRNAEEAMLSGGKISIEAGTKDSVLEIKVADTGAGIDKEDLDKIFDPFYTTKDTGTGLGLSFIRQVIGELGGSITCESQKNQGTTFRLFFPLK